LSKVTRIAFIGFGNHVVKNVLDKINLEKNRLLHRVYVRDVEKYKNNFPDYRDLFTSNIDEIYDRDNIDVIYILTPISTHFQYAMRALENDFHVWCEKPLTDSFDKSQQLLGLASRKGLFLGEVVAYRHHRQFQTVQDLIAARRSKKQRLLQSTASFCIPALEPTNIRYNATLSGGALLDVGFYPLSIAADLFGAPSSIHAVGHFSAEVGVDLSGSALLDYGDFSHIAHWAIGSVYRNEFEMSFTDSQYGVERAFSKPASLTTHIAAQTENGRKSEVLNVDPDDQFENMFEHFIDIMNAGDRHAMSQLANQSAVRSQLIEKVRLQMTYSGNAVIA
jgi:dTDP-3,4-didehydro-2,6-dideoxy-alpha-D-glucose 3-reductase